MPPNRKDKTMRLYRLKEYIAAVRQDNWRNAWCGFCRIRPSAADDCGFFFLNPSGDKVDERPACSRCLGGIPGAKHRALYGVGER